MTEAKKAIARQIVAKVAELKAAVEDFKALSKSPWRSRFHTEFTNFPFVFVGHGKKPMHTKGLLGNLLKGGINILGKIF